MACRAPGRDTRVIHDGPAERRRRFVAELARTRRREVVRRFGHHPARP